MENRLQVLEEARKDHDERIRRLESMHAAQTEQLKDVVADMQEVKFGLGQAATKEDLSELRGYFESRDKEVSHNLWWVVRVAVIILGLITLSSFGLSQYSKILGISWKEGDLVTPKDYIAAMLPGALDVQKRYGLPAAVAIAQSALETGWGKRPILDERTGDNSHNLFGIKAGPNDDYVESWTHEYVSGKKQRVLAKFKAYESYSDSLTDWASFLMRNPRYKKVLESASDPYAFADELQRAGYATDPDYAKKLKSIIKTYRLDQLG
jgi:hypothetical protein